MATAAREGGLLRSQVPCKHSRDNGSSQSDPLFLGEPPDRSPSGADRQHHSPVLFEQEGGTRSQSLNQLAR